MKAPKRPGAPAAAAAARGPHQAGESAPSVPAEALAQHADFVPLGRIAGVAHDLRYAGCNNFAGKNLYGSLDCAWLRAEAALGLAQAAAWLQAQRPGWRLLVLDALRPQRVQEAIWAEVLGTPGQDYFADPAAGSVHSFGMAVDVTLLDPQGREAGAAEMGSGFDEMSLLSHPALHAKHLARGLISAAQVAEREWLRRAMAAGGFVGISTEWWHFDHGNSARVRRELPRVL
jgi:zinc D-Ala-D-Ala dipeptidase